MSPPLGEPARVAVVIVSWNAREELLRCLASLAVVRVGLEAVVVDNASDDGSPEAVRRAHPHVRVIANAANLGFARASNRGWRATSAPLVLLLNPDAELRPSALETLVGVLDARPEAAVVGPRTVGSDGHIQVSTGPDLTPLQEWRQRRLVRGVKRGEAWALAQAEARHATAHAPVWVSGACLLVRRATLEALGGLDEGFFLYEEDVDLCVRAARLGQQVLFEPRAEVLHHLGRSMAKDPWAAALHYQRSHLRYYRKHHGPWRVAILRAYLGGLGLVKAVAALAGGPGRAEAAAHARALLGLALRGE